MDFFQTLISGDAATSFELFLTIDDPETDNSSNFFNAFESTSSDDLYFVDWVNGLKFVDSSLKNQLFLQCSASYHIYIQS